MRHLFLMMLAASCAAQQIDWVNQVKRKPALDVREYQFTRTNGAGASGDLSASGAGKTITLTPCPKGVAGANANHYVYIANGTGTAERAAITGGTCTSGAASGTIVLTTVNTHTGAWTVQSATAGGQEAYYAAAGPGRIVYPAEALTFYGPLTIANASEVVGQGRSNTTLCIDNTSDNVIAFTASRGSVRDLKIDKCAGVGTRTGEGISVAAGTVEGYIGNVWVEDQDVGIDLNGAWWVEYVIEASNVTGIRINSNEVHVYYSQFNSNTTYGVDIVGGTGLHTTQVTAASNGVNNWRVSGDVRAWLADSIGSSVTNTGAGIDLSAATVLTQIHFINPYVELSGTGAAPDTADIPGIKVNVVDGLTIVGGVIASSTGPGILLASGAGLSDNVLISGTYIFSNGTSVSSAADNCGIKCAGNCARLAITGNGFRDDLHALRASAQTVNNGFIFTGNYVETSSSGDPIEGTLTVSNRALKIQPNYWSNTSIPSYASAGAVLALEHHDAIVMVSGTTAITTIGDAWLGREVTLIFTDAAPGGLATGVNIARARTLAQNEAVTLRSNGTLWYHDE